MSFPPAPEYPIRTVSNFVGNSRRYWQVQVHNQYQRHRWQILPPVSLVFLIQVANLENMETISRCRLLKVNLKTKIYIYVNSTTQRCPNKNNKKISDRKFFPFATAPTMVVHLEPRISPRIFEKNRNGRNGILR